jgi:hypothetical protein
MCFNDDKPVVTGGRPYASVNYTDLCLSVCEQREHTIKDFLSRPILLNTASWTTSNVAGTNIYQGQFPQSLLSDTMYFDKINMFYGFKATMVFRVMVNSEPFQQGRLILSWQPQADYIGVRALVSNTYLIYLTQLPHVDLDIFTDSEIIFEAPYVSPHTHYNVIEQTSTFGWFNVNVYSPLISPTGSVTTNVQIWCYCKDIDLAFPARPQSVVTSRRKRVLRHSTGESELEVITPGPISSLFGAVGNLATALNFVPFLAPYVTPLAWASNILSSTASSFGWSKPLSTATIPRMNPSMFNNMANVNTSDNSQNIGMLADAAVSSMPDFGGTKVDEMAIAYIAQVPAYFTSTQWNISAAQDHILFQVVVGPMAYSTDSTTTLGVPFKHTCPLFYLASMFAFWRGSINFHIKVVKTQFHSGRLIFVFDPGNLTDTLTCANSEPLYRQILDLRYANEFTISIPYVSTTPYIGTGQSTGRVNLLVDMPLRAPSSVNAYVNIIVEVSGGPDTEFAVPTPSIYVPFYNETFLSASLPSPPSLPNDDDLPVQPQALVTDQASSKPSATLSTFELINHDPNSGGLTPAMLCIGERILSLRQILKRSVVWFSSDVSGGPYGYVMSPQSNAVNPTPGLANVTTPVQVDYLMYLAPLFNYRRGGIRVKFYNTDLAVTQQHYGAATNPTTSILLTPSPLSTQVGTYTNYLNPLVVSSELTGGGLEVEIPQYAAIPFFLNESYIFGTSPTVDVYNVNNSLLIKSSIPIVAPRIYRCGADDHSFGYFIGTVPLILASYYADAMSPWA